MATTCIGCLIERRGQRTADCDGERGRNCAATSNSTGWRFYQILYLGEHELADDTLDCCIDDIRAARFSVPALSTMAPDHEQLVDAAFAELERQLTSPPGADLPVRHVTIPAALVRRASTARR